MSTKDCILVKDIVNYVDHVDHINQTCSLLECSVRGNGVLWVTKVDWNMYLGFKKQILV